MRVDIDTRQIRDFEDDLRKLNKKALPHATLATVNEAAFRTQRIGRRNIGRQMVERNKFTQQSVRVNKAHGLDIARQVSAAGSVAPYLETQEFGGIKRKKMGSKGVDLPTTYSSGEGAKTKGRKRLPKKANKLETIALKRRSKRGKNIAQTRIIAIAEAAKDTGFIFLQLQKRRGIFRITGKGRKKKLWMVHDLTNSQVRVPRNAWLMPAVEVVAKRIPEIYVNEMRVQAERERLFTKR